MDTVVSLDGVLFFFVCLFCLFCLFVCFFFCSCRSASRELAIYELAYGHAVHLPHIRSDRQSLRTGLHEGPTALRVPPATDLLQFCTGRLQHVALLRGNTHLSLVSFFFLRCRRRRRRRRRCCC